MDWPAASRGNVSRSALLNVPFLCGRTGLADGHNRRALMIRSPSRTSLNSASVRVSDGWRRAHGARASGGGGLAR